MKSGFPLGTAASAVPSIARTTVSRSMRGNLGDIAPGFMRSLEAEAQAARELELVRVLGVADHVAAPVRIAPPARRVGLDVGRGPARTQLQAHVVAGIDLHARP